MKNILKYLIIPVIIIVIIFIVIKLAPENEVNLHTIASKEIERIISPDSLVEAVVVESNGGATSSIGRSIFLVEKNGSILKSHPVFISDHFKNLVVFWGQNNFLVIKYDQARIFEFTNFWNSEKIKDWSYVVEIRLKPTTEDFSLSDSDRWLNIKK